MVLSRSKYRADYEFNTSNRIYIINIRVMIFNAENEKGRIHSGESGSKEYSYDKLLFFRESSL